MLGGIGEYWRVLFCIHSVARQREVCLSRAGAEAFEMMILDDDVISAHI